RVGVRTCTDLERILIQTLNAVSECGLLGPCPARTGSIGNERARRGWGGGGTNKVDFRGGGAGGLWGGGNRVDLGSGKQRAVLAVLMLSAGQPVTVEALIDRVWADHPPEQVKNTLYSYIARLRGVFRNCPNVKNGRNWSGLGRRG